MKDEFVETTGSIARGALCGQAFVARCCAAGLVEFVVLPNGIRLLRPSAVNRIKELKAKSIARRGRLQRTDASATAA